MGWTLAAGERSDDWWGIFITWFERKSPSGGDSLAHFKAWIRFVFLRWSCGKEPERFGTRPLHRTVIVFINTDDGCSETVDIMESSTPLIQESRACSCACPSTAARGRDPRPDRHLWQIRRDVNLGLVSGLFYNKNEYCSFTLRLQGGECKCKEKGEIVPKQWQ